MNVSRLYPWRSFNQFVPQRSGLHRQSVIALYRALLSQCSSSPFDENEQESLRNIVRNRFRTNRHLRSPRRIKLSFFAGYRALDYLDGAVAGEKADIDRIAIYLTQIPEFLRKAPEPPVLPPKPVDPPYHTPPEHQFFNVFPRETVKGIRKVPFFVRANGFPMVRWKKPQPPRLGRTIRSLIEQKIKAVDYLHDYEEVYIPWALNEDVWDDLVGSQLGLEANSNEGTWGDTAKEGLHFQRALGRERQTKTVDTARRMLAAVQREQELAEQEEAARARGNQAKQIT